MSADKQALDDLDALFRTVPSAKTPRKASPVPASRPYKKKKDDMTTHTPVGGISRVCTAPTAELSRATAMTHESAVSASQERLYTRILPELLPPNLRAAPAGTRSAGTAGVVGAASAARLTEFVRGLLRSRGERAATSVMESKMQRKVLHLENMVAQSGAQSATARAARTAGRVQQGLSGKECKKKGLGRLSATNGGIPSFRELVGVHDLWKAYASRLASSAKNAKALEQRILTADLQGAYLNVSRASASSMVGITGILLRETANTFQIVPPKGKAKTVPKRGCAFSLAVGGRVITLSGAAFEGRRGGQNNVLPRNSEDTIRLQTSAL